MVSCNDEHKELDLNWPDLADNGQIPGHWIRRSVAQAGKRRTQRGACPISRAPRLAMDDLVAIARNILGFADCERRDEVQLLP